MADNIGLDYQGFAGTSDIAGALSNGFSINAYRNNNRVKIILTGDDVSMKEPFIAYSVGGISFDMATEYGSFFDDGLGGLLTDVSKFLVSGSTGKVSALDMSAATFFKGSRALKFPVSCFLPLINDYEKDIAEPLNWLIKAFLPSRGEQVLGEELDTLKAKIHEVTTEGGFWGTVAKGAENLFNATFGPDADIYVLDLPEAAKPGVTCTLYMGPWRIPNVIMESCKITMSPVIYRDPESGKVYPSFARVDLNFKTKRRVVKDYIKF